MSISPLELSKEVSYALRHAPWEYELELDNRGFVPIEQLLAALNEGGNYCRPIIRDDLEKIIATSDKRRHEIVGDSIRALYGHSVPMRILKERACPPDVLYHGTTHVALASIMESSIKPMNRQYVHLSVDEDTARRVGARRNKSPVILAIDSAAAYRDGIAFYVGNDKVWLADVIPARYISLLDETQC